MLIGSMFEQLVCSHSSLCVFPLFEKLLFIKLDSFLTDPQQIPIYRAPWTTFLNRFSAFSIHQAFFNLSQWLLDSLSIHQETFVWPIDSRQNLDPLRYFCHRQILHSTSIDSYLSRFSAQQISTTPLQFLYICSARNQIHFFSLLSRQKIFFNPSKHSLLTQIPLPT